MMEISDSIKITLPKIEDLMKISVTLVNIKNNNKTIKRFICDIPENRGGVYFLFDTAQHLIYVGITNNFKNRLRQYFSISGLRKVPREEVAFVAFFQTDKDVTLYEKIYIKIYTPKYNRMKNPALFTRGL